MSILPEYKEGYLIVPLLTAFAYVTWQYACWYSLLFMVVGTTVIDMQAIENIPGDYVVPVIATIIACAIVLYLVFYLVSYQEKASEVLKQQAEALQKGTAVDEISLKRVENFHFIYKVAMFLGVIVTSAITFALMATVIPAKIGLGGIIEFCVGAGIVTVIVFAIFDYFVGRPIADNTFKRKVIDPLQQAIVAQFQSKDDKVADESVSEEDLKLLKLLRELKKD